MTQNRVLELRFVRGQNPKTGADQWQSRHQDVMYVISSDSPTPTHEHELWECTVERTIFHNGDPVRPWRIDLVHLVRMCGQSLQLNLIESRHPRDGSVQYQSIVDRDVYVTDQSLHYRGRHRSFEGPWVCEIGQNLGKNRFGSGRVITVFPIRRVKPTLPACAPRRTRLVTNR